MEAPVTNNSTQAHVPYHMQFASNYIASGYGSTATTTTTTTATTSPAPAPSSKPTAFSSKIAALLEELSQIDPTHKSIVFSQWTSMLDLIESAFVAAKIKCVRLDGKMPQYQREKAIKQFQEDPEVTVFLISMKAGGVGLNLVAASHVFLMDPWWNPAAEEQAIDRVHRIGQQKQVYVTKFVMRNSIEERIVDLQQKKKYLAQGALGNVKADEFLGQMKLEELRLLFRD